MANGTIRLYQQQIDESVPPLSDGAIAELERKIQELEEYKDRLEARAGEQ
jgi:hypothetical protein